jgi:hypothetical protein
LHRERYRMPVKHLDPGAEVAGTTEAAKAFLRPLAAPPLRPAFPQAGVASFRRLGRWALARAGTEYVRRVACCVLRVACCVLRVACCVGQAVRHWRVESLPWGNHRAANRLPARATRRKDAVP